jgi:hypothetical protein
MAGPARQNRTSMNPQPVTVVTVQLIPSLLLT